MHSTTTSLASARSREQRAARATARGQGPVVGASVLRLVNGSAAPLELTPNAVVFLNALCGLVGAPLDPWAKYPAVLGVRDVAAILGTTPAAVSEAARVGALPMRKLCGKWRIDQIEFRRLCGYRDATAPERTR